MFLIASIDKLLKPERRSLYNPDCFLIFSTNTNYENMTYRSFRSEKYSARGVRKVTTQISLPFHMTQIGSRSRYLRFHTQSDCTALATGMPLASGRLSIDIASTWLCVKFCCHLGLVGNYGGKLSKSSEIMEEIYPDPY